MHGFSSAQGYFLDENSKIFGFVFFPEALDLWILAMCSVKL